MERGTRKLTLPHVITLPHVKQTANGNLRHDPGDSNRGPVTIAVTGGDAEGAGGRP